MLGLICAVCISMDVHLDIKDELFSSFIIFVCPFFLFTVNKTSRPKSRERHHPHSDQRPAIGVSTNLNGSVPICVSALRKDPRGWGRGGGGGLRREDPVTYFRIHNMVKVRSQQPAPPAPPTPASHHHGNTVTSRRGGADACARKHQLVTGDRRPEVKLKEKQKQAWKAARGGNNSEFRRSSQINLISILLCL